MTVATYTNIVNTAHAMFYQGYMLEMTCILKEGNITITSSGLNNYKGAIVSETFAAFASPLTKGSLVSISTDTANTSSAAKGVPVVTTPTAGDPIIGIILGEPEPIRKMPTTSASTWSTMLAAEQYRVAKVGLFCRSIIPGLTPAAASNAISPGSSLIYDLSSDGLVFGRVGPSEADSAVWDGSGADTGANGFLMEPISLHYSATNTAYVAIALGLWPIRSQA